MINVAISIIIVLVVFQVLFLVKQKKDAAVIFITNLLITATVFVGFNVQESQYHKAFTEWNIKYYREIQSMVEKNEFSELKKAVLFFNSRVMRDPYSADNLIQTVYSIRNKHHLLVDNENMQSSNLDVDSKDPLNRACPTPSP